MSLKNKMKVIKISKKSILKATRKRLKKTFTNVKSAELAAEAVAECNRVRGAEILGAVFRPRYSRPASHTAAPACRGSLAALGDTNRGLRAKQAAFGSSLTSAFSSRASSPCPLY